MPDLVPSPEAGAATLELTRRLVACRSISPDDAGTLDLIGGRLAAAGFTCERVDRGATRNLWARHGRAEPVVCLAGHVDVVPPGPADCWTSDPFVPVERGGCLYGRGAADMKASVAAMVTAAERVAAGRSGHGGSIALLLTSDEEGDGRDGTVAVVEWLRARGTGLRYCLVGEPTCATRLGDTMKNGRRGSLTGVLTVRGTQGHVAYAERARNPVHAAAPALAELVSTVWDGGDDAFSPTSFQVSNVHAGTGASNVIPATLEVTFNFRYAPASAPETLRARVQDLLDRHGVTGQVVWTPASRSFLSPPGRLTATLADAVHAVTGTSPTLSTTGGSSDGRFLIDIADELVEFGPVNASIHAIDEHVRVADLGPLSLIYERTVTALIPG